MAEEHVGPRPAAWTKIFTGFKVALDLKKLLLAGAGVLAMAVGWWLLSLVAYGLVSKPMWERDYADRAKKDKDAAWTDFKARRASWNLLYELAGRNESEALEPADVASTWQEYEALTGIRDSVERYRTGEVTIVGKDKDRLKVGNNEYPFTIVTDDKNVDKEKPFLLRDLTHEAGDQFRLSRGTGSLTIKVTENAKGLREDREKAANLAELRERARNMPEPERKTYETALRIFEDKLSPHGGDSAPPMKFGGKLRTWPWFEFRGENPYLIVAHTIKETSAERAAQPGAASQGFLFARLRELVPVLLEPIVKILTPIINLFDRHADWYVQIYLLCVLVYALAVWAFFGGAITRLAAVQVARNEKIPLREAVIFAKDRFVSFFAAPAFPLVLLAFLVVCLWLFGWVFGLIPLVGDILIAGLLWPLVLIAGLVMAVVLVGLVGWPLMNPTISVEGSDSFDALSRSYSYVYQAPWHYLWYAFLATLYGAVLIFFVGLMASLVVFLGKWGVSMTPGIGSTNPKNDREPSFLFVFAPTTFGWRDLLTHNSRFAEPVATVSPNGLPRTEYRLRDEYRQSMTWYNYTGAVLVSVWIYLFLLLVIGFGYSYFWSAATIIYFLMRRQVDDTDMDEVHLEEEEATDPFARPPAAPPAPPSATAPKTDKVSLSIVEPPALRTAATPGPPSATLIPPAAPTEPAPVSPGVDPPVPPVGGDASSPPPAAPPPPSSPPQP
jgi:hypothetical protein